MSLPEPPDPSSDWVAVALLGKTRGNRGELTALPLSSKPERYQSLREVFLFREERGGLARESAVPALAGERFEVESAWFHLGGLILKFRGVDTISDAERLAGAEVRVPLSERAPLEPDEFFLADLVGCEVIDRAGASLGKVSGWEDSGGSGLLVVEGGLLIPFARSICVEIDAKARRIVVELPEGLKDLNRP